MLKRELWDFERFCATPIELTRTSPLRSSKVILAKNLYEMAGFAEENFSWEQYIQTRPKYPKSMFDLLYNYHGAQGTDITWALAMDVGAGHGPIAEELARRFEKVVVCDPNEEYLAFAKRRLDNNDSRFEFYCRGAEDRFLSPGTVDMLTMGMSIHWTDDARSVETAAYHLRPGGTLAIIFYRRPFLVGNADAAELWDEIWDVALDSIISTGQLDDPVVERSLRTENSGMDCIAIPPEMYTNVQRIKINASKPFPFATSRKHFRPAQSAVTNDETLEEHDNVQDWVTNNVTANWLMKALKSYCAGITVFGDYTESRYLQKLDVALAASHAGTSAVHPVSVILATKR